MFTYFILLSQLTQLMASVLALGTTFKGPFDLKKLCKVIEMVAFIIIKIMAVFIIVMGIITIVVIRAIWKFK